MSITTQIMSNDLNEAKHRKVRKGSHRNSCQYTIRICSGSNWALQLVAASINVQKAKRNVIF